MLTVVPNRVVSDGEVVAVVVRVEAVDIVVWARKMGEGGDRGGA